MGRPSLYTLEERKEWCCNCWQGRHKDCKKTFPLKRTGELCICNCEGMKK